MSDFPLLIRTKEHYEDQYSGNEAAQAFVETVETWEDLECREVGYPDISHLPR